MCRNLICFSTPMFQNCTQFCIARVGLLFSTAAYHNLDVLRRAQAPHASFTVYLGDADALLTPGTAGHWVEP